MGQSSCGYLTAVPPLRRMRNPPMAWGGSLEKLAIVFLRILLPSLQASLRSVTLCPYYLVIVLMLNAMLLLLWYGN